MPKRKRRSRKRSAASFAPKQPENLVLFIDRSLGRNQVSSALQAAGATVRVHDDHFAQDIPDAVWLAAAGEKGWVVLTKDTKIRKRANERMAMKDARVRAVILTSANLSGEEMGQAFAKVLRRLERLAANHRAPWIATLTRGGDLSLLEDF